MDIAQYDVLRNRKMHGILCMFDAIGARLREERVSLGMSQAALATIGDAHRNSQIAYEAGRTPPAVDYLLKIGAAGADVGYILTGARSGGSLGVEETWLIEMFRTLSSDQRQALVQLLMAFTGRVIDAPNLENVRRAAEIAKGGKGA